MSISGNQSHIFRTGITGLSDEKSVNLAFEVGAAEFITKPIKWGLLCQRVRRLLQARQTQAMLDITEASAKSIISHSLDGIITIDGQGMIKSFNPAAERIFGYSAAEIAGQHIWQLMPGAYRKRESDRDDRHTNSASRVIGVTREITATRKDGSDFPVEITISGFYHGDRLLTVRDITRRKMAEERLRMSAKVFENLSEGIMVTDEKGNIQLVNQAFSMITGYQAQEVTGRNPRLLKSGRHDPGFYESMWETLLETGQWQGEIWNRRKDGEIYQEWLSISAIRDERGLITHFAAVFSDTTERYRIAEEKKRLMEQTARAQRLASLGTISAGIAHEINQPLNSIKVIVDGMIYWQKKGRVLDKEKIFENLQRISARAGRIDEIIKHMRTYVSVGNLTRLEPCNLNDAVTDALRMVGHQMSSHGIVVKKMFSEELPPVIGNANRLEEVVVNLLVNAMQALDSISRRDKEIICRTGKAGQRVFLEIIDNATGISDEIMDKIFDPFYSTKKTGEGMGLGLSIVQSVISGCNGEIKVLNNEKGGATFQLFLPAAESCGQNSAGQGCKR